MRRIADALALLAGRGACVLVITHDLELMGLSCARGLAAASFIASEYGGNAADRKGNLPESGTRMIIFSGASRTDEALLEWE